MRLSTKLATMTAALCLSALLSAQGPGPRRGMGMRMYNPDAEITIKGTVDEVTQGARGQMMGTHLMVKTADATTEVMLGPSSFIRDKGFSFAKGDSVEITGAKTTMGGKDYLIAREVVKDGKTLTLRDKTGRPQWAGRMGPNPPKPQ
jgi:hypothetical protein